MRKAVVVMSVVLGSLVFAPSAGAVIPSVFGGDVECRVAGDGVRECGHTGINERQTVTITNATGGTFTLTFSGQTTAPIAFNATAAQVDAALEALSNIGADDVAVTGAAGGPYTVEFTGALGNTDVAEMTADGTGLTGGGANVAVVAPRPRGSRRDHHQRDLRRRAPRHQRRLPARPGRHRRPLPPDRLGPRLRRRQDRLRRRRLDFGMRRFTSRGYAVMSMTTRGFRESCGSAAAQTAGGAACNDGYVRLMDTRYEVRDYQDLAGELAEDGLAVPTQIGAVGGSYGGGLSMALGALKNRQMLPTAAWFRGRARTTASRCHWPRRSPTSPGATWPIRSSRTGAPSTTRSTTTTAPASG